MRRPPALLDVRDGYYYYYCEVGNIIGCAATATGKTFHGPHGVREEVSISGTVLINPQQQSRR